MKPTKVEQVGRWHIAGPFDNPLADGKRTGLDIPYAPEVQQFDKDAVFAGRDGVPVSWKRFAPHANGFFEVTDAIQANNCVVYAATTLLASQAGTVVLDFGCYRGIKVLVNGACVGRIEPPAQGAYDIRRGMGRFQADLKPGTNDLLVKCEREDAWYGFFFQVPMTRPSLHEYLRAQARLLSRTASRPPHAAAGIRRWQRAARKTLTALMGFPAPRVKPAIKRAGSVDAGRYVREHFYFASEQGFWVPAFLMIPKSAQPDRSSKALLCLHGHGHGKSDIAGLHETPEEKRDIDATEYDYAHRFAELGYVVITIDSRGFGELGDLACASAYALANTLDRPLVGMRVWDAMRALDILEARPEVDLRRIGCTGVSWGGTHTSYVTMLDPRIKAALVSGYFSTYEDIMYREAVCTCQYLPGAAAHFDFPELLFGLACPRPLYIQHGEKDPLYTTEIVRRSFKRGQAIYRAAGVAGNAYLEVHPEGHKYRFEQARAWFEKVL